MVRNSVKLKQIKYAMFITILQIQQAGLTNVFHLTAGLTHFSLLEAHSDARTPTEHSEGTRTDLG